MIALTVLHTEYAIPSNATTAATTKTFQDFGLGFKIEYPSNMTIQKASNNITLSAPGNTSIIKVIVTPWAAAMGLSGLFTPPNLDTFVRQISLAAVSNATAPVTITNKTKVLVDNTSAYLLQSNQNYKGKPLYIDLYVILREGVI
jgi:hypothetical protein